MSPKKISPAIPLAVGVLFAILKSEIAKWKSKVQTAEGVVGAEL